MYFCTHYSKRKQETKWILTYKLRFKNICASACSIAEQLYTHALLQSKGEEVLFNIIKSNVMSSCVQLKQLISKHWGTPTMKRSWHWSCKSKYYGTDSWIRERLWLNRVCHLRVPKYKYFDIFQSQDLMLNKYILDIYRQIWHNNKALLLYSQDQ